ncbi:MAG: YjbQ family protein [Bdellovibrionales bacterium]|nr:YjbQ family protein [Bdellovibrionales bacterium]
MSPSGLTAKDWLLDPGGCPGFERSEVTARMEAGPHINHTETLWIKIPKRYALVNIQDHVEAAITRSGVVDGLCLVSAMHITAGIYINDAESGLLSDISSWIEHLAPFGKDYAHHQTGEDNGDAHLKSYLTNHSVTTPITQGRLDFGTWQQIFYAEFDGRRSKRVLIKIMGLGRAEMRSPTKI